ncbi:MAG: lactonase family protein, partial [Lachnospira sp.]
MDKKYVAYVGSYTHENSKGIHIYDCDVAKGRITERAEVSIDNPSFIAFSSDRNFLYAICDQGVSAYAILDNGDLELMNVASINGMRGCHICVTSDNRFLIVSGYHDGKITVMRINADGSVGCIADEV